MAIRNDFVCAAIVCQSAVRFDSDVFTFCPAGRMRRSNGQIASVVDAPFSPPLIPDYGQQKGVDCGRARGKRIFQWGKLTRGDVVVSMCSMLYLKGS